MRARNLTLQESQILEVIQTHYGYQNTAEDVSWVNGDEAVLWVQARDGSIAIMVNLTNLADLSADGTIASTEELKRDWLQIENI